MSMIDMSVAAMLPSAIGMRSACFGSVRLRVLGVLFLEPLK